MSESDSITRMIQQQIANTVNDQVLTVLTADEWIQPLEQKILQYTQDRILNKFANSTAMPEIIAAVKDSVAKLFAEGNIPGIEQFVDPTTIRLALDQAVEQYIQSTMMQYSQNPEWQAQIERLINQSVMQETLTRLGAVDLGPAIKHYVDQNMKVFTNSILKNFVSTGINDQGIKCELTVMEDAVVIENCLTANRMEIVDSAKINNLVITGSINTDNHAWAALAADISKQTLNTITDQWNQALVQQVVAQIQEQGVAFEHVKIGEEKVIEDGKLSKSVVESNLQSVGQLKTLQVRGEAHINNNTVNVMNKRLGVNTDAPEKALSVWDEEVSIVIGKHKINQAYIGTNRDQGIVLGVNREPQLEINTSGLTIIKQLQVGVHKISHATQVPGWSGTKGDIVFNASPNQDRVFAWVCLGAHKWQTLKGAE